MSETQMTLTEKLIEVKKEINPIKKDQVNPFTKSKFFDINTLIGEIEPILLKHGLLLTQPIIDGSVHTVIKDAETSEIVASEIELPKGIDPQKMGSAITYYRRYTLVSLLALQSLDDDGERAMSDILKLRQQAEDLLDTSIYEADRKVYGQLLHEIENGSADRVSEIIRGLRENQKEPMRKSMTEINKELREKIGDI